MKILILFRKHISALIISIAISLLFFLIGYFISPLIFKISLLEISFKINHPEIAENVGIIKYFLALQSISFFLLPSVLVILFSRINPLQYFKTLVFTDNKNLFLVAVTILVSIPFLNITGEFNKWIIENILDQSSYIIAMEESAKRITEAILPASDIATLSVNLIIIALLPALGEEFLFRGIIQNELKKVSNPLIAVIVTSVIFSSFHFQFLGFIPRLLLSIYLGFLFIKHGSIWLPVFAHFTNNAFAVIMYYLISNKETINEIDKIGTQNGNIIWGILSGILSLYLL